MRSKKTDISFFDEEILKFILNEEDSNPKENITILGGLAVNVSPMPDFMFGNMKLQWGEPVFLDKSMVEKMDYSTGLYSLSNPGKQEFKDLKMSFIFKCNSGQFIIMGWDKNSKFIKENNLMLEHTYPYTLLSKESNKVILSRCTNEYNCHLFQIIDLRWSLIEDVAVMREMASGGYSYKKQADKEWEKEEIKLAHKYARK